MLLFGFFYLGRCCSGLREHSPAFLCSVTFYILAFVWFLFAFICKLFFLLVSAASFSSSLLSFHFFLQSLFPADCQLLLPSLRRILSIIRVTFELLPAYCHLLLPSLR
uniref:Uncharacterized protein n=1 Tax=Salix viminalis TaxID=40686 RepID=A0A6N2KCU7_SALVM